MQLRSLYRQDPSGRKLVNEGVANVNDGTSSLARDVLRYELETFVCDGQYGSGMAHILNTYLKNIDQAQQPAVWVSGFYGSGKSHMVKMLRALWMDTTFDDGAKARGIADLPQEVRDHLKELTVQSRRYGGLHAASGTLGAGASGSVRLALLGIVFRSVGLPEQYPLARFVMWLRKEGIEDRVRAHIEAGGFDWEEELANFYVAEGLHAALIEAKPQLFASSNSMVDALQNTYPNVQDVSNQEMISAIRAAISRESKLPLTLVVLDEVQQFIGTSGDRAIEVQEMVEAVVKDESLGGKLTFVGTGQTAVTGTPTLAKLQGRFTIRIELSDADVDAVVRQVILAKKTEASPKIEAIMQENLGEISRHLSGTSIGHRQDDVAFFAQDYPILPVRRRFWEAANRVLDASGTDSQLRNQLSLIHKAIRESADKDVGFSVPADFLYFDGADKLLQARILPRKLHEKTMSWIHGRDDQKLTARACGIVFLINKIGSSNSEIGIKATIDTIADLLVEDLPKGSSGLRSKLPKLLDACDLIMRVGDEYRIQTEESSAWNDEFLSQKATLANQSHRIEAERDDLIRKKFGALVGRVSLLHGNSKVTRDVSAIFDPALLPDANKRIYVWIRDGWTTDDNSVRADARQAGNQSPTVFVFIPRRSADDLRNNILEFKAASATLEKRGAPDTPEGKEARGAMETIRQVAEANINELVLEAMSGARVFQGGGNELTGNGLQATVTEAAENSLTRLYPQFAVADNTGWSKVYDNAHKGAPDSLKAVGHEGEPEKNAVCKAVLSFIAGGKKGTDIRDHFEGPPFGWSRDAVDGALLALLVSGLIRAEDEQHRACDARKLERKSIGRASFIVEATTISTPQRIQIRKVLQKVGLTAKQGEELSSIPQFVQTVADLAKRAGGDAPKPKTPDLSLIDDIRRASGNEQLLSIFNARDELSSSIDAWNLRAKEIDIRWPSWDTLRRLSKRANGLTDADVLRTQVQAIEDQRQLLADPDPMKPLIASFTQILRDELNRLVEAYKQQHETGMAKLKADDNWQKLQPDQRNQLLSEQSLAAKDAPVIKVGSTSEIIETLNTWSLSSLEDRVRSLPARFDAVLARAAEMMEPSATTVHVKKRTIKSNADLETWLNEAREDLAAALAQGPVIIR
ncbi:BREX system P-loop protein BrxC [Ruegeria sp. HKCCE4150]|uniref:BREX system P-loop protein BrxC n=1 Tax=Ruegeria sp. HKCCE4150 TaxID=2794828 RepID=UPI001AE27A7F|nr:BREX system P-loop protein BrxC [Ruegeria sp. HKCCE4150]